jgi:hypothetical protein
MKLESVLNYGFTWQHVSTKALQIDLINEPWQGIERSRSVIGDLQVKELRE